MDWDAVRGIVTGGTTAVPAAALEPLSVFLAQGRRLSILRRPTIVEVPGLPPVLTQGLKAKKKHEVERVCHEVDAVYRRCERCCVRVVDLGSGEGYLSHALSYGKAIPVVSVDADAARVEGSIKRANRIEQTIEKQTEKAAETGEAGPQQGRAPAARTMIFQRSGESELGAGSLLVGLHTCGDLAPASLRSFAQSTAGGIVSMGCCYRHLSTPYQDSASEPGVVPSGGGEGIPAGEMGRLEEGEWGYPMSGWGQDHGPCLPPEAMELACHSAEEWGTRSVGRLVVHGFRALLQVILDDPRGDQHPPAEQVGRLRVSVHKEATGTAGEFRTYAETVLTELRKRRQKRTPAAGTHTGGAVGVGVGVEGGGAADAVEEAPSAVRERDAAAIDAAIGCAEASFGTVERLCVASAALFAVRAVAGMAIERIIHLDRAIYLHEALGGLGHEVPEGSIQIKPLFDPAVSPRNTAIVCTKGVLEGVAMANRVLTPEGES